MVWVDVRYNSLCKRLLAQKVECTECDCSCSVLVFHVVHSVEVTVRVTKPEYWICVRLRGPLY